MTKKSDKEIIFEQYKLAVDMADKVSSRKYTAIGVFMSMSTIMLSFIVSRGSNSKMSIILGIIGLFLCFLWYKVVVNYKKLNKVKFDIINTLEIDLPIKLFTDERKEIKKDKNHKSLSDLEKYTPILFGLLYFIIFIYCLYISNKELIEQSIIKLFNYIVL